MGPAFFVIAILGCGEAEAPCQQVQLLDARYESQAACSAATGAALEANSDAAYPVVVAQCVSANAASASALFPADIALPEAERRPSVRPASASRS